MNAYFKSRLIIAVAFCVLSAGWTTGCQPVEANIEATAIRLDKESATMLKGEELTLSATVMPDNATDRNVVWKSSNATVAEVSQDGVVTAVAYGNANITASVGKLTATCAVSVVETPVESVTITAEKNEIAIAEKLQLTATVLPETAENKTVTWTSSNTAIATISTEGEVTGMDAGTVEITAQAGNVTGTFSLIVKEVKPESITVDPTSVELKKKETKLLSAAVAPANVKDKSVVWTSSDESVVIVNENGDIVGVGEGWATITATCGEVSGTCQITVGDGRPEAGDYYYSDGSYSTELYASKDVIGIVFNTGENYGGDDDILGTDHPGLMNALVVSINGEANTAWQTNAEEFYSYIDWWAMGAYSILGFNPKSITVSDGSYYTDNLNKRLGYNNTRVLRAFNNDSGNAEYTVDAVTELVKFEEKTKAPAKTSGWYIPSPKELTLLCYGEVGFFDNIGMIGDNSGEYTNEYTEVRDLINSKLKNVEGAVYLKGEDELTYYLSSAEHMSGELNVSCVCFSNGQTTTTERTNTENVYVRYILSF